MEVVAEEEKREFRFPNRMYAPTITHTRKYTRIVKRRRFNAPYRTLRAAADIQTHYTWETGYAHAGLCTARSVGASLAGVSQCVAKAKHYRFYPPWLRDNVYCISACARTCGFTPDSGCLCMWACVYKHD